MHGDPLPNMPWLPLICSWDGGNRNNDIDEYVGGWDRNYPAIQLAVRSPSAYVRVDVVPVDTPLKPTYYGFDPSAVLPNKTITPALNLDELDNFLGVQSYGSVISYIGVEGVPYDPTYYLWNMEGLLSDFQMWNGDLYLLNGSKIGAPRGDYRLLVRALERGQDWEDPLGYESWLSPVVRLNLTSCLGPPESCPQ